MSSCVVLYAPWSDKPNATLNAVSNVLIYLILTWTKQGNHPSSVKFKNNENILRDESAKTYELVEDLYIFVQVRVKMHGSRLRPTGAATAVASAACALERKLCT